MNIKKLGCLILKDLDVRLGGWSREAMMIRGFSTTPVHPKHLFDETRTRYLEQYLNPDVKFLDIGSGVGTDCILAVERKARLAFGLELSWKNLDIAKKRSAVLKEKVFFACCDLENGLLPFDDDIFDVINCTNVLEHLERRSDILAEISRVKRKNGVVILSVPNAETTWKRTLRAVGIDSRDDTDHKIEYVKTTLENELANSGLKIISPLQPTMPSFPLNGWIAMSAFFSPTIYKFLQKKKVEFLKIRPEETAGWIMTLQ